jgi:hypothetical protein
LAEPLETGVAPGPDKKAGAENSDKRGPGRPKKTASSPKGSVSSGDSQSTKSNPLGARLSGVWGRVGEPLGAGEARRGLLHVHVTAAKLLRSEVELQESDFDDAGDAFADVANKMFPPLRLVLRAAVPLVLIGALIGIWSKILRETPWWQNWRAERRARREQERAERMAQARLSVVDDRPTAAAPDQEPQSAGNGPVPVAPPIPARPVGMRRSY